MNLVVTLCKFLQEKIKVFFQTMILLFSTNNNYCYFENLLADSFFNNNSVMDIIYLFKNKFIKTSII